MDDIVLLLIILILLVVLGAFLCGVSYMVSSLELKVEEKKIEMLQEKGLLDENSLKIILQNL